MHPNRRCAGCGHAYKLHDVEGGPPGCSYNGPEVDCTCPCADFVPPAEKADQNSTGSLPQS